MKYIKPHPDKCAFARECMKICAQKTQKSDDLALSAIVVTKKDGGGVDINVCNQCGKCIDICAAGAIYRSKAGTVLIKKSMCVGCYSCVEYCPTGSMRTHSSRTVPFKCISCGECVEACPSGALEQAEGEFEPSYTERGIPGETGETFPGKYF
jgi:Fe-S-cluster-containing hydrogenase component 2